MEDRNQVNTSHAQGFFSLTSSISILGGGTDPQANRATNSGRSSQKQLPFLLFPNIPIPARNLKASQLPSLFSIKRTGKTVHILLSPFLVNYPLHRQKGELHKNMGFLNLLSTRSLLAVALLYCCSIQNAIAQTTTSAATPASSSSATIYPGTAKWTYYGCYNETTGINGTAGLRALSGGTTDAVDTMSVPVCLNLCEGGNFAFAGLEYKRYYRLLAGSLNGKLTRSH